MEGWRNDQQIATNDRMLRNLLDPLTQVAPRLRHVTLLQGTKAYGVHVRALAVPAREDRSEMREQPNFYWAQEDYVRAAAAGRRQGSGCSGATQNPRSPARQDDRPRR